MIKILFCRSENAYLPEIDAYIKFFNNIEGFEAHDSADLVITHKTSDFDVIWEFKGFGGKGVNGNQILVHEYASLSTGKLPYLKNIAKSILNPKPSLRVFLNQEVKDGFNFNDEIQYVYRDMGINEFFYPIPNIKKEYDFVYIGAINKERELDALLKRFAENTEMSICLIGDGDTNLMVEYSQYENIIFKGRLLQQDIPLIAQKAKYALNYIPDKYPFNVQTSTKLLEYLAMNLPVVTTSYKWASVFEEKHKLKFFKLNKDLDNLDINKILNYDFDSKGTYELEYWNKVIENSGLEKQITDFFKKK